ncbi:MAG: nucleotidyltransferase family protein [Actinomycetota bacterium]
MTFTSRATAAAQCAGIVLAAGSSSRLGQPKQLLELEGRPLVQHAVDAVEGAGLFDVVVVLGHRAEEVQRSAIFGSNTRVVVNPDYLQGQATSLRTGLQAMRPGAGSALVILGDQPAIDAAKVRAVVDGYASSQKPVVQATYSGKPGHPVLFDRSLWAELIAVEGDRGAREVLKGHPKWIYRVELGGEVPADVDTWEDYERLKQSRPDH